MLRSHHWKQTSAVKFWFKSTPGQALFYSSWPGIVLGNSGFIRFLRIWSLFFPIRNLLKTLKKFLYTSDWDLAGIDSFCHFQSQQTEGAFKPSSERASAGWSGPDGNPDQRSQAARWKQTQPGLDGFAETGDCRRHFSLFWSLGEFTGPFGQMVCERPRSRRNVSVFAEFWWFPCEGSLLPGIYLLSLIHISEPTRPY